MKENLNIVLQVPEGILTEEIIQIPRGPQMEKYAIHPFLEKAKQSKVIIFKDIQYHITT